MPNICPECGADQALNTMRCDVCGARMVPQEEPSAQIGREDIFSYSVYVIGLLLLALGVPCLLGLLCFLLGH